MSKSLIMLSMSEMTLAAGELLHAAEPLVFRRFRDSIRRVFAAYQCRDMMCRITFPVCAMAVVGATLMLLNLLQFSVR